MEGGGFRSEEESLPYSEDGRFVVFPALLDKEQRKETKERRGRGKDRKEERGKRKGRAFLRLERITIQVIIVLVVEVEQRWQGGCFGPRDTAYLYRADYGI